MKSELGKEQIKAKEISDEAEKIKVEQAKKIESMEAQAIEQARRIESLEKEKQVLQSELEEMKGKVGEILSLLFHRKVSEAEASARLSLLGCEVEYCDDAEVFQMIEGKAIKEWEVGTSSFLLDDRQKLSKLMVGRDRQQLAITSCSSANPASLEWSRMPVVSFPKISQLGNNGSLSLPQLIQKLPDFNNPKATKAVNAVPISLDSSSVKDQDFSAKAQKISLAQDRTLQHSAADVAQIKARGPTLKFVYSAQGSSAQPWIAKLPFSEPANSPIKPMKEINFKAEMSSDDFGVNGLAVVMGKK